MQTKVTVLPAKPEKCRWCSRTSGTKTDRDWYEEHKSMGSEVCGAWCRKLWDGKTKRKKKDEIFTKKKGGRNHGNKGRSRLWRAQEKEAFRFALGILYVATPTALSHFSLCLFAKINVKKKHHNYFTDIYST